MRALVVFFLIASIACVYSAEVPVRVGVFGKKDVAGILKTCSGFEEVSFGQLKDISTEALVGYDIVK